MQFQNLLEIKVKDLEEEIRKKNCIIKDLEVKQLRASEVTNDLDCDDETLQIIIDKSSSLEAELESNKNMKPSENCTSSSSLVHCVLCPQPVHLSVPAYLFHIAREHVSDQYMMNKPTEETNQVRIFLEMLEVKAKKEADENVRELENTVQKLREKVKQHQNGKDEGRAAAVSVQRAQVERLQEEVRVLEESLEEGRKQIEVLVVANRTLKSTECSMEKSVKAVQTEVSVTEGDTIQELNKLKDIRYHLENEVKKYKHEKKDETLLKRKWRNRFDNLTVESKSVKRKSVAIVSDLERFTEALVEERLEVKQERLAMMARIRSLEAMTPREVFDEIDLHRQGDLKLQKEETEVKEEELVLKIVTGGEKEAPDEKEGKGATVRLIENVPITVRAEESGEYMKDIGPTEPKKLRLQINVKNVGKDESDEVKKYHAVETVKEFMKQVANADKVKQTERDIAVKLQLETSVEDIESDIEEMEEINFEQDRAEEHDESPEEMSFDYSLLDSSQE